ncbi:MAG: FtsX-like permease family protein [Lachnospiraceae bacterium]|nr:FtsX-like permease family protein [Lachnospiraceae bacterium]
MKKNISLKNLAKKPGRTAALTIMAALLCLAVFGGSLLVKSLTSGFSSLEDRLGAEIMVIPEDAAGSKKLQDIVLQGNTGYFYMDYGILDEVENMEGVGECTGQFFLASAMSNCCSARLQIIGFDPDTDFVIKSWIQKSYSKDLGENDIVIGNGINAFVGDTMLFYGVNCHVVSKLAATGTSYDYSVFTTKDNIRTLIASSLEKKLNNFGDIDPYNVVSSILINTDGTVTPDELAAKITETVPGVTAIVTNSMISGISDTLSGVGRVIRVLIVAVCVLAFVITAIVFAMSVRGRKKEFATMRLLGATRNKIAGIVFGESAVTSLIGSIAGIVLGIIIVVMFGKFIEEQLGLPYLLPGAATFVLTGILAAAGTVISGTVSSVVPAIRISRADPQILLKE